MRYSSRQLRKLGVHYKGMTMSFWKSLFGGSKGADVPRQEPVDYNGFSIEPAPYAAEGQYQVAGFVRKDIGGEVKEHKFVRADRFSSMEEATTFSIMKAKQIIDQMGDKIFK